ncbi:MAG TPA: DUF61 family protein [Thermoplasmata archaeon]|nr:DUF61 family protein [Thermoplasmata archaeon]
MTSPGGVDRWVAFELGRLNAGLVTEKKSLAALLAEDSPACRTREGGTHPFDRDVLTRVRGALDSEEAETLRLPITLFVSGDVDDSASLRDGPAAKVLRTLESFGAAFPFRDGRMYLPHSLALDLVRRYGGVLQIAFG